MVLKDPAAVWWMEQPRNGEDLRRSLEQILQLCVTTVQRLRSVLEENAPGRPATTGADPKGSMPDEGVVIEG